jgi:hypothetical protein
MENNYKNDTEIDIHVCFFIAQSIKKRYYYVGYVKKAQQTYQEDRENDRYYKNTSSETQYKRMAGKKYC